MALNFANNNSLSAITSLPASISGGGMTLIQEQTASNSSTISFTSGIDSTYNEYVFKFYDIHPEQDSVTFYFNLSADGGSNYNITKTTTIFRTYHFEDGSSGTLNYDTGMDLAQSTAVQGIGGSIGNGNDECLAGTLHLFSPSDTTFVKHFLSDVTFYNGSDGTYRWFVGGYGNTTSAVNAVQFSMNSNNFNGVIKLYGIS